MLHVLFVILKILGIILACILGLLLLLILVVLFVPIRYRVDVKKREDVIVKMRVNWLLRILFVRGWYIDNQLHIKLRIFGFTIWDNLQPKKEKKAKIKKAKIKKVKIKKGKKEKPKKEMGEEFKETDFVKKKQISSEPYNSTQDELKYHESVDKQIEDDLWDNNDWEKDEDESEYSEENQIFENDEQSTKAGKIKRIVRIIKDIFHKIKQTVKNIKSKISQLIQLVRKLLNKKNLVSLFLKDEMNRTGIKFAFGQLLNILKHCGPQKIEGYVKFGTGDPEQTGKILGIIAVFYGKYGDSVLIEPDFEEKVFEAEGMVKGRIRIFHLLIIGIKVIRDKNIKMLIKNARQLKEEL